MAACGSASLLLLAGRRPSPVPSAGAGFPLIREFFTPRSGWAALSALELYPFPLPLLALVLCLAPLSWSWPSTCLPTLQWTAAPWISSQEPPSPVVPSPSTSAMAARLAVCVWLQSVRIGPVLFGSSSSVRRSYPPGTRPVCPSHCPVLGRFRLGHFS